MHSNIITRYQHRRYINKQGILDKNNQSRDGLNSFPDQWKTHVILPDQPVENLPRKIWMLWLQGEDDAPPLVKASFKSWRDLNPNWEVKVLSEGAISDLIDLPNFPIGISPNHKANIIRLLLLSKLGGVWTDATTLCLKPLNEWIDYVTPHGFFAFSKPQPLRPLANWFIASTRNSPAVEEWLKWSTIYIINGKVPDTYFWQHFTFKWLIKKDPVVKEIWANTPHITARGPHILQRILDGDLNSSNDPTSEQMALLPLVKLNWKKGYTLESIDKELLKRGINLQAVRS